MRSEDTTIEGVQLIHNFLAKDERGLFVKTFNDDFFSKNGLQTTFKESYFSISHKRVIRGMHFQLPPYDHEKLVYVTDGTILDVILDLRKKSATYGQFIAVKLDALTQSIYIPRGCAHGFLTLSESATVGYNVATSYNNAADSGIKWDSFGFDEKNVQALIALTR